MLSRTVAIAVVVHACALVRPALSADEPVAGAMRVRLEWGGGEARRWSGLVELDEGRFEDVVLLGVDADLPGSTLPEGGAIWIQRHSPRVYDGFDVLVRSGPRATLRVTLQSPKPTPLRTSFVVPLAEIASGDRSRTIEVGRDGDRVVLRRTPGDVLALRTDRPHLVFEPGEEFEADIAIDVRTREAVETRGRLSWSLTPAHSDELLMEESRPLTVRTNDPDPDLESLALVLPEREGAYDLHVQLDARSFRHRTRIPLVVASGRPAPITTDEPRDAEAESPEPHLVDTLDPERTSRRIVDRAGRQGFLKRSWNGVSQWLAPPPVDAAVPDRPWAAYRLDVDARDTLHEVVVTFDATTPRTVGVSLLQPNAAGRLVPIGIDTAVEITVSDGDSGDEGPVVRHVVPFHARVERPVLLLHTIGSLAPIAARRIEVFAVDGEPKRTVAPVERTSGRRLVGPYLHRPLLPEAFSAPEAFDADTQRSLDDWTTFDVATRRFTEYLHRSGNNAALLAVMADGSTIFPSRHLQPALRYDTGLHLTTGRDPLRKDVVELLLRRFDRERLALVPMLRFSTALPELERLRSRQSGDGLSLVHEDGRTYREVHPPDRSGRTDYNPLDPRVQEAVLAIVREFAERYADHPSLSAIAIEIGSDGCLRFPGVEWGFDDATLLRFARDTASHPESLDLVRRELRDGTLRERWDRWRRDGLVDFHSRIARTIAAAHPDLRCVFVVDGSDAGSLDTEPLARLPRTTILERADPECENDPIPGRRGFVGFREPVGTRLRAFDELSPWQPGYTWLAAHVVPAGDRGRRTYVRSLALDDTMVFDGGWIPRFGQTESTRAVRATIAGLPDGRFDAVPDVPQPLVVRAGRDRDGSSIVVVVNDFPHAARVKLATAGNGDDGTRDVTLGPHDFHLLTLADPNARLASVEADIAPDARSALRERLSELDSAIVRLRGQGRMRRGTLENPGFEAASAKGNELPGWSVREAAHWDVDRRNARSGQAALVLAPEPRVVAAVASNVTLEHERHVIVGAWLRADRDDADVRLVFESTIDNRPERRLAPVRVTGEWRRYEFRVEDVPPTAENARVRFEVRGPARVWIDDVDVRFSHVTPAELRQLETTSAAASLALERGRYADARRLLEGPCRAFVEPARVDQPATEPDAEGSNDTDGEPGSKGLRLWPWRKRS